MAKTFAPKPSVGLLETSIENFTLDEMSLFKADVLSKTSLPIKFSHRGVDIEIVDGPKVTGTLLEVSVTATRNLQPLFVDNPLFFNNPPIKVFDGTWRKETDQDGNEIEVMNFKEDPLEALKEIIVQTVELQNK